MIEELEFSLFQKMDEAFRLGKFNLDGMPIDDTQIGVEFAMKFYKPYMQELSTLRAELDSITDQLRAAKAEAKEEKRMREHWLDNWKNSNDNYHTVLVENIELKAELDKLKQPNKDPVAEVGRDYTLVWLGRGPIAPIFEKHGLSIGSKLYAHPVPPQQVPDDAELHCAEAGHRNYFARTGIKCSCKKYLFNTSSAVRPQQVPDIEKILGKLNHVLKMNRDVMTGTGVVYIEEVCRMLSPTPPSDEVNK